jgi:hypothetical protein
VIVANHGQLDEHALRQVLAVDASPVLRVASVQQLDASITILAMSGINPD